MSAKPEPKGNPQPGGSGTNPRTTRAKAQKGAATVAAAKDNVPPADPMTGTDPASNKVPSIREQLTTAYEAKVAETKSTRDPRLLKKKGNLKLKKKGTYILTLPTTYPVLTVTYLELLKNLNKKRKKSTYLPYPLLTLYPYLPLLT